MSRLMIPTVSAIVLAAAVPVAFGAELLFDRTDAPIAPSTSAYASPSMVLEEGEVQVFDGQADQEARRSPLADRMVAALSGKLRPRASTSHRASPKSKRWLCGEWEDLVQGSGQGRDCAWK